MRDLQADLEICNKATPGPWYGLKNTGVFTDTEYKKPVFETGCGCCTQETLKTDDAQFIAAAREGWPEAIERAIKAEQQLAGVQDDKAASKESLQLAKKALSEILSNTQRIVTDDADDMAFKAVLSIGKVLSRDL